MAQILTLKTIFILYLQCQFYLSGWTVLHHAAYFEKYEIMKFIIDNGAAESAIWNVFVMGNTIVRSTLISNFNDPYFRRFMEDDLLENKKFESLLIENGMI